MAQQSESCSVDFAVLEARAGPCLQLVDSNLESSVVNLSSPPPSGSKPMPVTPIVGVPTAINARRLFSEVNELADGQSFCRVTGRVAEEKQERNLALVNRQPRSAAAERMMVLRSPTVSQSPTSSRGSEKGARTFKEMLESVKKLHASADNLQERICRLHHGFGGTTMKAAFLFKPETVTILNSTTELGIPKLPDPDEIHFLEEEVDNGYENLIQVLAERPDVQLGNEDREQ